MAKTEQQTWSLKRAQEFYNIPLWGEGYFSVNEQGHMLAMPDKAMHIDLMEVCEEIRMRGLSFPVLIRLPQILRARVQELDDAFRMAANHQGCQIRHIPYYPIKVNQQRAVIETILSSPVEEIGLEVGSKTELLVALGLLNLKNAKLICNGYKDRAYIRIALYAQQMGIDVTLVIENLSELDVIKEESLALGVVPKLGMRIRMYSIASGNWQNSGGRDAKFGLDSRDIQQCLDKLSSWECKHWLQLVHFHMGSQLSSLEDFRNGLKEALRLYEYIWRQDFNLYYLDMGGGLAVDYASTHDTSYFSKAYSMRDYADVVVETVNQFCQTEEIPIPVLVTENGRALTAHHAVLVTNVLEVEEHHYYSQQREQIQLGNSALNKLAETLLKGVNSNNKINPKQLEEFEILLANQFLAGEVSLHQRAKAEAILRYCHEQSETSVGADKYYCNFSIFQSLPDVWGLNQLFPIVPLARLNEEPVKKTRLHDLTCDSDGQISHYAVDGEIKDCLLLHEIDKQHEPYLLGIFLIGAYQEVLGDMHNLFGDTHALNVEKNDAGQLQFTEIEIGDCVNEMLNNIHLDGQQIIRRCKQRFRLIDPGSELTDGMIKEINNALFGYTYLDSIDRPVHRIKR